MMTESEPLNENSQSNGKIAQIDSNRLNGVNHTNGKHLAETSAGSPLKAHIEAPCCRDIHGKEPPDGGTRAWLVMVSAFLCNGVIFGIINTYGVIHNLLTERLELQGDSEASSKAGSKKQVTTNLRSQTKSAVTHNETKVNDQEEEFNSDLQQFS